MNMPTPPQPQTEGQALGAAVWEAMRYHAAVARLYALGVKLMADGWHEVYYWRRLREEWERGERRG